MSEVGRYRDLDGLVHWASRDSKNTTDRLADGSFVDLDAPDLTVPEPPRSGSGSGVEAWREYAPTQGVTVTDDMTRNELMAAVDASREVPSGTESAQHGDDHDTGGPGGGSGQRERTVGTADDRVGDGADQSDLGR